MYPKQKPPEQNGEQWGTFNTNNIAHVSFKLPEFSNNKTINWKMHVDESTNHSTSQYDLIIGTDLMAALKINL